MKNTRTHSPRIWSKPLFRLHLSPSQLRRQFSISPKMDWNFFAQRVFFLSPACFLSIKQSRKYAHNSLCAAGLGRCLDSLHFGKQFKSTSGVNSLLRDWFVLRFATLLFHDFASSGRSNAKRQSFFLIEMAQRCDSFAKHGPIVLMASLNSALGRSMPCMGTESNRMVRRDAANKRRRTISMSHCMDRQYALRGDTRPAALEYGE